MTHPEIHEVNDELGLTEPLPDFIGWLEAADRCGCRPWDLLPPDSPQPPRWWWADAALIVAQAEAEAQRVLHQRDMAAVQQQVKAAR